MKSNTLLKVILELSVVVLLVLGFWFMLQVRPRPAGKIPDTTQAYPAPERSEQTATPAQRQAIQPYPAPSLVPTPEPAKTIKPPACKFPDPESAPKPILQPIGSYQFSEPKIVLTSKTAVGIAGWLPDGERLLITRSIGNGRETIETLDTRTGETVVYAERGGSAGKPIWIDDLNAVAFASSEKDYEELVIAYGEAKNSELINHEVFGLSLALYGNKLIFFSPKKGDHPQVFDLRNQMSQAADFTLKELTYSKFAAIKAFVPTPGKTYQISIQPDGLRTAFYGNALLFYLNSQDGEICEINLGIGASGPIWASSLKWSSNGHYLAMLTQSGYPGAMETNNRLLILNAVSGEKYYPELKVPFVYDLDWSPDDQTVLLLGKAGMINGRARMSLITVRSDQKTIENILPNQFFGGGGGGMLAWKKDKIDIDCTSWPKANEAAEGRVCIIEVTERP